MARPRAAESLTSYIDEHNRFILNGEPFFPLGLYVVQHLSATSQLDEIANSPFDTLMNYNVNNGNDSQIAFYLNQLHSRNLKLIFSLSEYFSNCEGTDILSTAIIDTITHKVETFKHYPAIISWYMNDERSLGCLSELEAGYKLVRGLDDDHPVWSVHWNTDWLLQEAHTTDIVGVDPYPIDNHPITLVSQMADAANKAGKPLWLVPQIFDWKDYPGDAAGRDLTGRPPTREEMRAMTYLAVNHGAKGLIYYSYFNIRDDADYDTRWPQIKEIASEIDYLRPVLLSTHQTNDDDIVCDNGNIDFKLVRGDNAYYLLVVNTKEETISGVPFQIALAHKPAAVEVLFEGGRQLSVNTGNFTDDFDPYEVHVYHWEEPDCDKFGGDTDEDGVCNDFDNCPDTVNADQADSDGDGIGDACDGCPNDPDNDADGDGVCGDVDPCPYDADNDADNDGVCGDVDGCPNDENKTEPEVCGCGVPDIDSDDDGTLDCGDNCPNDESKTEPGACGCGRPDTDKDNDGILDCVEDDGPNGGDGNGDTIPDGQQPQVASLETYNGQDYVILESTDGSIITNCQAVSNPSPGDTPADVDFPYGFFSFTISGVAPGGTISVILTLYNGTAADTYWKYGSTPTKDADHWYEFQNNGNTGAEIDGNEITLHFVNGDRGDDDTDGNNSVIVDVGGPGVISSGNGGKSGGGGCFTAAAAYGSRMVDDVLP